jgi:tRNA (mo5U34)-methyltransferase
VDLSPYDAFFDLLRGSLIGPWSDRLERVSSLRFRREAHGDLPRWWDAVRAMPDIRPDRIELDTPCILARADPPLAEDLQGRMRGLLQQLHPWRKGPYCLHGIRIDCEWRSDWKWDRLADRVSPLKGRIVLDVGCGNGYHCWRMAGAGAGLVLGIDPTVLYVMQHLGVARFLKVPTVGVLPLALEDLPGAMTGFDTVFSMGVLYHRRSPIDHLLDLRRLLRTGGELVLETLVLEAEGDRVLVPGGRYARMRNVWLIPAPSALLTWLGRCGFRNARLVDVTPTTVEEQRSTDWMRFQSLKDSLDPEDTEKTVEGLPAPRRGILIAEAG